MALFYKSYYTLRSMISDLRLEVVYDDFIVKEGDILDPISYNGIQEIYAEGGFVTEMRYDIRINGLYHEIFLDELVTAFNNFTYEIKDNLKFDHLKEYIPSYLEKLKEELTKWGDNITEYDVKIGSDTIWYYLPQYIDKSFLESDGVNSSIINNISNIFSWIKHEIVEIIESIEKIKNTPIGSEINIPEEIFSGIVNPTNTTVALDIYQTAILFYYLKKHGGINPINYTSLARLVSALTGHSEQNIRTEKGFGAIANILADKTKNQNFRDTPNYNLVILKEFLQKIIKDIEIQAEKNHPPQ